MHAPDAGSCVSDPVQAASSRFRDSAHDVVLPGRGVPFTLSRTYNSEDITVGPFGRGWSFSYGARLELGAGGSVTLVAEDGQRITYGAPDTPDARYRTKLLTAPGGYELVRADQTVYSFDSAGRLTSMLDRNGFGLTFAYGQNGLSSITDGAGRTIAVSTNIDKLITRVELPDGRAVDYAYTDRQLTSVTDVRGGIVRYEYTPEAFVVVVPDPEVHPTRFIVTPDTGASVRPFRTVHVIWTFTVWLVVLDVLVLKFASPLYVAEIVFTPIVVGVS